MTGFARLLAAAAVAGALAAPATAQYPYPQQPYPQTYPPGAYPPGYGYQQPYGGNVIDQVIGQLLGNRYNVTDRNAVSRCASAAMVQAQNQYRGYNQGYGGYGGQPYNQPYGYNQGYSNMRVTAITDVERRSDGLRVRGLLGSGSYGGYGNQGYGDPRFAATGELSFRCTVDYRGVVTNVRVRPNTDYRRY